MDEEFLKQYTDLLITQYFNQPKAKAEIELIITNAMIQYLFLNSFKAEYDLTTAWGNRLDVLGKIVGVKRIVTDGILKTYFGFDGLENAEGFGQAPFYDLFKDSGYTDTELSDAQMRFYIHAKAIKNATSAYLTSDEKISLQDAFLYLFDNKAYVTDNYSMSITLHIDDSVPIDDITLAIAQNLLPHPQGVRIFLIKYNSGGTFGFASDPSAKGFGEGAFAQLIPLN